MAEGTNMNPTEPGQELALLAERLEDRASIVHFAWTFGLSCAAVMGTGVGLKLLHDSIRAPKVAYALLAVGVGALAVALYKLGRGLSLYRSELRDYARFTALREEQGLDGHVLPLPPA